MTEPLDLDALARRETALGFIKGKPALFRDDFADWLADNFHVWLAFEREANRLRRAGVKHWSARSIIHYLRHETAIREGGLSEWKVNNNASPDLARLYVCHYPKAEAFFEFRAREAVA